MSSACLGGVPIFAQHVLKVCSKFGLNLVPPYGQAAGFAPRFASTTNYFLVGHQQIFGLKANFGQTLGVNFEQIVTANSKYYLLRQQI